MGILLDDGKGRRAARAVGLQVLGSGGALIQAKRMGLLPEVRPALASLLEAGLYLSMAAQRMVLSTAGE